MLRRTSSRPSDGQSSWWDLWRGPFLSGLCFLVAAVLGLVISRESDGIASLWLANGILLSALLIAQPGAGRRHVATCSIASLIANAWAGASLDLALAFTVANLVTVGIAFYVLRRLDGVEDAFKTLRGTAVFFIATTLAVPTGAAVAAIVIALSGGNLWEAWTSWAASDAVGMVLVVSLMLPTVRLFVTQSARFRPRADIWAIVAILAALLTATMVFAQSRFPLLFLPLAAVLFLTYRLGVLGAALGVMLVALVGAVLTATGRGPIVLIAGSIALRIQFFQFYLVTLAATSLPLAILLEERARLAGERLKSERRHRRILERSREVIFETDLAGRWTYLNPAWATLTGLSAVASLGQSFMTVIIAEDRDTALERLSALYARAIDECLQELRFVHIDGTVRWASVKSHLLVDGNDTIVGTYGTIHDISDAKRTEAARIEGDRLYRLLADHSNDMIVRLSLTGVRHYVSPASISVLGYEPHEMVGDAAAGSIHPDDRAMAIATCRSLLEGVANPVCLYRQRHKDGHYVWLEASYRLIRDAETGLPLEFIASVRDVGRREEAELERAKAAARLREANRLLVMSEDLARVGHWRLDLASSTIYWSDVVCEIHGQPVGYSPLLADAIDAYHPDDRAMIQASVDQALATGKPYDLTARLIRTDGCTRHVVARIRAETGPDGSVLGLFGVFQDVTEAHMAETALRETSQALTDSNRMLTLAEAVAHVGHWRLDRATGALLWSDEVYAIYGLARDVRPTVDVTLSMYHPADREAIRATIDQAVISGTGYCGRARVIRPDGKCVYITTRCEADHNADGDIVGFFGIVQDVTEQALAEAMLSEREARFRLITEQASDMISLHDLDGRYRFMSPASRAVLGRDPDEMLNTTLYDHAPVEDHPALDRHYHQLRSTEVGLVSSLRFRMRQRDGELISVEIAARLIDDDGTMRIIAVCRDVSVQVAGEAALLVARQDAEAAARAKSTFLANMSHEIRTPMNGVIGFTDLLLASNLTAEQRRQADLIAESGRAMMSLLNDILDLSKVEAGQMRIAAEEVDLPHVLTACMKLMTPACAQKGITLTYDGASDLPDIILGDGLRLRQIILNLLGNAVKFTQTGSIKLRATVDHQAGGRLCIEVQDTGIGIAADRQAAIFEQFVQAETATAAKFGGTGLGLAISAQLARLMGGDLKLKSVVGEGTSFFLSLPCGVAGNGTSMIPRERPIAGTVSPDVHLTPGTRVLVAEDHDVNQLLMTAMLEQLGCCVDIADNGAAAIDLVATAAAGGRPYAVVLMDMQMPVMDGLESTRRIRAAGVTAATLPIIALTANAYADDVATCLDAGMQAHIAKPVRLEKLATTLQHWVAVSASRPRFSSGIEQRYRERKEETLRRLETVMAAGAFSDAEMIEVQGLLHKLAGTAGMFGDQALGDQAHEFCERLADWTVEVRAREFRMSMEAMLQAA